MEGSRGMCLWENYIKDMERGKGKERQEKGGTTEDTQKETHGRRSRDKLKKRF